MYPIFSIAPGTARPGAFVFVQNTKCENCKNPIDSLGFPFSDPTAEGPVIQGANLRALQGGVTTDKIFDFIRELRKDVIIPMFHDLRQRGFLLRHRRPGTHRRVCEKHEGRAALKLAIFPFI